MVEERGVRNVPGEEGVGGHWNWRAVGSGVKVVWAWTTVVAPMRRRKGELRERFMIRCFQRWIDCSFAFVVLLFEVTDRSMDKDVRVMSINCRESRTSLFTAK